VRTPGIPHLALWAIGLAAAFILVAQPLIGYPRVLRLPAVLAPALALALIVTRPWRWSEAELRLLDRWQPTARTVWSAAALATLVLFWIVLTRFRAGDINAVDFTVYFDRPCYQTLHGRPLFVETADAPGFSWRSELAVHGYWALLPIAGLYALYATPYWLLALSVAAVVLGGVHVLRIMQRLDAGGLLASATALAFVLNANTARTLLYGFHPEVLYAWFVPAALDAGLRGARGSFLVAVFACVTVKEDACMFLFAVAVALALTRSPMTTVDRWIYVAAPIGIGLANLGIYYYYVVPALVESEVPTYSSFWSNYGPTPLRALAGMAAHPVDVARATLSAGFFRRVILPHAFLPVVGWRWTIGVLPVVALYSASANRQLSDFGLYYAIPLVPFLVIGASVGALTVARRLVNREHIARITAATVILLAALIVYGDRAGYSLRPWKEEIAATPRIIRQLANQPAVLVQSGLYPHAGYDPRIQLLTPETLRDTRYAGAALVLAPRVNAYPFTTEELKPLAMLPPVLPAVDGVLVVRRP
jgi:uncharacterized membrane protein